MARITPLLIKLAASALAMVTTFLSLVWILAYIRTLLMHWLIITVIGALMLLMVTMLVLEFRSMCRKYTRRRTQNQPEERSSWTWWLAGSETSQVMSR